MELDRATIGNFDAWMDLRNVWREHSACREVSKHMNRYQHSHAANNNGPIRSIDPATVDINSLNRSNRTTPHPLR